MDDVRVGVVGAGFAASSHIEALRRTPSTRVVGIAASTPNRTREAAQRLQIPRPYAVDEMIVSEDLDAIHNCTPNHLHADLNHAILDAGKHLLSEKPLALTSAETFDLEAHASRTEVVAGVCHNYRHYPLIRHARELLDSGDYGVPHFVHGTYLQDWLLHPHDWNWRLEVERAGESRAIADIGTHWLDLVQYLMRMKVVRVCARLMTLHDERIQPEAETQTFESSVGASGRRVAIRTEDLGAVLLEFDGGVVGAMTVSQVSPGRKNALTFNIDTDSWGFGWNQEEPNRLWLGRRDDENRLVMRDPALLAPPAAAMAHYPAGHEEGWADGLKNLMIDFYAAIEAHTAEREHESSFATFADAHQVTCVVESIMRSNETRAWVDVETGA